MGEAKRKEETKKEAFDKDPDRFIDMKDLVIGAVARKDNEGNNGIAYYINPSVSTVLLKSAVFDIQAQVVEYDYSQRAKNAMKNDSGIITPGGNGKRI